MADTVARSSYSFENDGTTYTITLPALYGGIGTLIGFDEITADPPANSSAAGSIKQAVERGLITRITIRAYELGANGSATATRTIQAFAPTAKVSRGGLDNIVGSTLTKTIYNPTSTVGDTTTKQFRVRSAKVKTRTKIVY